MKTKIFTHCGCCSKPLQPKERFLVHGLVKNWVDFPFVELDPDTEVAYHYHQPCEALARKLWDSLYGSCWGWRKN